MNYYVCLQNRICLNLMTCLLHEMPGLPFWQFWYDLLYSSLRNLFLSYRFLSLNYALKYYYCRNPILNLCQILIFLNLNWIHQILNPSLMIFLLHGKLHHPFWQFWYDLLCSSLRSLFLSYRFPMMICFCFLNVNLIRNLIWSLNQNVPGCFRK